ncbi:retrovirus-related pol polyprotein from transposon TNT 1-94 [Tanacetum coccineum]
MVVTDFVTFTGDFSRYSYVYLLKEHWREEKSNTARHGSLHDESNYSSKVLLDYALESTASILNMVPTKKVNKTSYEVWHGQASKLSYLKVWGCEALVKRDTLTKPKKLEPRSIKCVFVGYPKETMGYSFYYPLKNKVFVARNAKFFKNSLIDQEASRSLEDLEIIQEEDTHPSLDTSLNHEEDVILPCIIGNHSMSNALADLGASISIMPYSLFKRLGLGSLNPIKMTIEMADRSMQSPKGIKENVLVKISNLVFPIDFVILDIMEDENVLIILGRPMLATAHVKIDVYGKKISLGVGNDQVGNFENYLLPKYGSQDIISLLPTKLAEDKEDFSMTHCNPEKRMSIGLEEFVDIDDMWDDLDLGILSNEKAKTEFLKSGEQIGLVEDRGKGTHWFKMGNDKTIFHMLRAEKAFRKLTVKQHNSMGPLLKVSGEDKKKGIHKPEKKIKGFYRGCLSLGEEYKYNQEVVDWIQRCIDDGMTY